MSTIKALTPHEALELFKEHHPDLNSVAQITLTFSEARFVEQYAPFFKGDRRKARQVYHEAQRVQEQNLLLWAGVKDAVASPYLQNALFNNIPQSFIDHVRSIPGYNRLFGNLDFIECDHSRSIFGPAAYFVDLMRFVERHIPQDQVPPGHSLEARHPRLFRIPLDHENTYTLIPYIDLINEVLEDVVRTPGHSPYAVVEAATFPMQLPFHLPLAEIRLYLQQLKISLQEIYQLFSRVGAGAFVGIVSPDEKNPVPTVAESQRIYEELQGRGILDLYGRITAAFQPHRADFALQLSDDLSDYEEEVTGKLVAAQAIHPEIAREILALSPRESLMVRTPEPSTKELTKRYGLAPDLQNGKGSLNDVEVFTEQTGLSRQQLNELLFLDLSGPEIQAGLSRFFFINNTGDQQGHLWIEENVSDGPSTYDHLHNLTAVKLDRIYRFLKLARKLGWSFRDLDWALRSLQQADETGSVLRFDGVNDFVEVAHAEALNHRAFTLEAWVLPAATGSHPIIAKGQADGAFTHWLFWITEHGKLAFFSNLGRLPTNVTSPIDEHGEIVGVHDDNWFTLMSDSSITQHIFSHVAVTINGEAMLPVDRDQNPATPPVDTRHYQLKFYINGVLDSTWSFEAPIPVLAQASDARIDLNIGKNLNDAFFTGSIAEMRIWEGVRTEGEIAAYRFKRCTGQETALLAYWPLVQRADHDVPDLASMDLADNPKPRYDGRLGGESLYTAPVWVQSDLPLDPLPQPISPYAYHFDGVERYAGTEAYERAVDQTTVPPQIETFGQVKNLNLSVLTLETWVEITKAGVHPLICKGDARQERTQYHLWIDIDNRLILSSSSLPQSYRSIQPLPLNQRVHVAAVVEQDAVTFYLNGAIAGTFAKTVATLTTQGEDLYLGRDFAGAYLRGVMQEVRIWQVARTQSELRITRDFQLTGSEPNLAAYWRLDEADPQTMLAQDRTFNRNDLSPGGILETYRPTLEEHPEVIIPTPVASEATTLHFDDRHYAVVINNQRNRGLGFHEQGAFEFWFKADEPANTERKQLLFTQGDAETGLNIYLIAGQLYLFAWCVPFDGKDIIKQYVATVPFSDNGWHHLTFTYDERPRSGIAFRAYLDGVRIAPLPPNDQGFRLCQVGQASLGGLTAETFTRFHDEGVPQAGSHHFAGQIGDFRLWKKAIPEAEIVAPPDEMHLRHIPPALDETDLLCYLPMTEGYGSPVSDRIGPLFEPDPASQPPPTILDKSSPLYDQTRHGRHGRLYVGPDAIEGKWADFQLPLNPHMAYRLEPGQLVTLAKTRELGMLNHDFTIELWVRLDGFAVEQALIGTSGPRGNDKSNKGLYLLVTESGHLRAGFYEKNDLLSSDALAPGQWHHIAWRLDLSRKRHALFVDGQPQGETTGQGISLDSELYLAFSQQWLADNQPVDRSMQGEISELRVWDSARSAQEIEAQRMRRLAGDEPHLQAYWVFDQDPRYLLRDRVDPTRRALIEIGANDDIASKWVESDTPFNTTTYHLAMDGASDFIDLQDYRLTDAGTIELWLKFAREREQILFDAATANGRQRFTLEVFKQQNNFLLRFSVHDAEGANLATARIRLPADFDDRWHHIAITWQYDGQNKQVNTQLYLDDMPRSTGEQKGNKPKSGAKPAFQTCYIGTQQGRVGVNQGLFQGRIRPVRIWDFVRYTAETVDAALRDLILVGGEVGLQVYLPLTEGRGALLHNLGAGPDAKLEIGGDPDPDVKWVADQEDTEPSKLVFHFDEDLVALPHTISHDLLAADFTVEVWINLPALSGEHPLLATRGPKADPTDAAWALSIADGAPQVRMAGQLLRADDLPLTVDTWHHVACQYTAATKTLHLLLDGVISQQSLSDLAAAVNDQRLYIGHWRHWDGVQNHWESAYLQGLMAEMRLWTTMRPLEDLQRTMKRRLRGNETGLLAYWVFNGDHRTRLDDCSARRRHLSLKGSDEAHLVGAFVAAQPPILIRPTVATLDGYNDYLDLGSVGVSGDNGWTLEFWLQCADPTRKQFLFDKAGLYWAVIDQSCFRFEWASGGAMQSITMALSLQADQWVHLAFVYAGAQLQLFANGVPTTTQPTPLDQFPAEQNGLLILGASSTLLRDHFFEGRLAECRLWQGARTAQEIQENFWRELRGREEKLDGYWPFGASKDDLLCDYADSYAAAQLVVGLEDPAQKWLPLPPPINGAISALALDGKDDYIDLHQVVLPPLTEGGDFTVEAWFYVAEFVQDRAMAVLGSRAPQAEQRDNQVLRVGVRGHKPYLSFYNNSFLPDVQLSAGWRHLAWQYEAATGTMRIILADDTVFEESGHPRYLGGGDLFIGRWDDWDHEAQTYLPSYFKGLIGEVRVWDELRDPQAIAEDRDRRLLGDEEHLIAYWVFDDQNQTAIPSRVVQDDNLYALILRNDLRFMQPLWHLIADHPVLLNPLARQCFAFDGWQQHLGSACVELAAQNFTLEAWVRMDAIVPGTVRATQDRPILWHGDYPDSGPQHNFGLHITAAGLVELVYWSLATDQLAKLVSTTALTAERFTHLAVVVSYATEADETTIRLLVNGVEDGALTFAGAIRQHGRHLLVGRSEASEPRAYFDGLIQEVRLWQEARSEQDLLDGMFHPVSEPGLQETLGGYWPLGSTVTGDAQKTPDLSPSQQPLIIGGLVAKRTPLPTPRPLALNLPASPMPAQLAIPVFNRTVHEHRLQRTVEIWFISTRPFANERQIVYREGDEQRGLSIYIQAGRLHFRGWNRPADESNWRGAHIVTDRIDAHFWHHAVLMLDGRAEVRDHAFCALLDGKVVEMRPGSQLWGAHGPLSIGGLSFTPVVEANETILQVTEEVMTGHWLQTPAGYWHDCKAAKGENVLHFVHQGESGFYRIALQYPADDPIKPRFASAAPVEISHIGGVTTLTLDQRDGGDLPLILGVFELESGQSSVRISNDGSDGLVVFESLRFIPIHYQRAPSEDHPDRTANVEVHLHPRHLHGQVKQVRIWETTRTRQQIRDNRHFGLPVDGRTALLFHWQTDSIAERVLLAPWIEVDYPSGIIPSDPAIPLAELADLETLRTRYKLPIDKLSALWSMVNHTGLADKRTLFDEIYNPAGTPDADKWFYSLRLRWEIGSTASADRAIRTRLMSALRVSSADLDQIVGLLSPNAAIIILDGDYLSHLYRVKLLTVLFRASVKDLARLLAFENVEVMQSALPELTLATLRLAGVMRLDARIQWMAVTGIDLSEYGFLVHEEQDQRVALPYTAAQVVDLATALLNQVSEFSLTPQSLVSEEIGEAAAKTLNDQLLASDDVRAVELRLPAADGVTERVITMGVVSPLFDQLAVDPIPQIAKAMNWPATFEGLYLSADVLQAAGLIDKEGRVAAATPEAYTIKALEALAAANNLRPDLAKLVQIRDLLVRRVQAQMVIPGDITTRIKELRGGLNALLLTALAELLASDPERLLAILRHTTGNFYKPATLLVAELLDALASIVRSQAFDHDLPLGRDLYQLSKILFLLGQFDLSEVETESLLAAPLTVFGIEPAHLAKPTQRDLTRLHTFVELKTALGDPGDQLVKVLEGAMTLTRFPEWPVAEIETLRKALGEPASPVTIPALERLAHAFRLIRTLGANASFLVDLARTVELEFAFYARHAAALFDLVRAKYDDAQWERVYKPIHDLLAIQKRDSLTAVTLQNLAAALPDRKSPDLLYEYLLIDVQTGSEVDTSRIVQGLASLQLYVQRCLMNLEMGVKPEQIPMEEWAWMKNYRVWEANRKVFLYPENYIEPELRDSKTPLFQQLEEELQQGDVTEETVSAAYTHYLDGFAEVANLKIVGSYVHRYLDAEGDEQRILFLVGRTDTQPRVYYYRKHEVMPPRWHPWQRIDLTINSDFVTPVFAFNRLFLFWSEFSKLTKSVDRKVPFYYDDEDRRLPLVAPGGATQKELADVENDSKSVDPEGYLINELSKERVQENVDIYKPVIKYTYYNFSNVWIPPQTYFEPDDELREESHLRPKWQRVYAQRTLEEFLIADAPPAPPSERAVEVLQVSRDTRLAHNIPGFTMTRLTWEFWVKFDNTIPQGLPGTISEEDLDRHKRRLRLVQYDDPLQVEAAVKNNLTRIPSAPDLGALARNIQTAQERVSAAEARLNNAQSDEERQAAAQALSAARGDLAEAQRTLAEARQQPQWESRNLELEIRVGTGPSTKMTVDYAVWQHVALVMTYADSGSYVTTIYLSKDNETAFSQTRTVQFSAQVLRTRQGLVIGQAEAGNIEDRYHAQMSEFRLWEREREPTAILGERHERKRSNGVFLFQLPLDSTSASANVFPSTLKLSERRPPIVTVDARERIIILYGGQIRTIRNNLQDANFALSLDPQITYPDSYDLNLTVSKLHVTLTKGLSINDFATEDESTLTSATRIHPTLLLLYRLLLIFAPRHPLVSYISRLLEEAKRFDNANPLLSRLPSLETTFADVNNQPGWYLLDTGDEQFLITADLPNLLTTAERMHFRYGVKPNDSLDPQPVSITILKDPGLLADDENAPTFKFRFTRLSTFAVHELSENLYAGGLDRLLSLSSQETEEQDFDSYEPNDNLVIGPEKPQIDFNGAHGLYYWEVFFHIPFLIANTLNANQKFAEAQRWYHFIFNPTAQEEGGVGKDRYWRFLPFRARSLETLVEILTNDDALAAYRKDPFDPHAIARLRLNTYQKTVVMKYIDNLLDWGDYLFRQDTRESINEALTLYVLAFNLLGPRPKARPRRKLAQVGDYHDVQADLKDAGEPLPPDFLIDSIPPATGQRPTPGIPFDPNRTLLTRFCVPENEHFIGYWDRVEDRLFKIRHSRNIDGIFRQLALFQPPIDPAALVRAVAGGLSGGFDAVLAAATGPVPHYRYAVIIEKAKAYVDQVITLGNLLLATLEKKDAEDLTLLRHGHELNILTRTLDVKRLQKEQAEASLDALRVSLQSATTRRDHYDDLLNGPGPFGSSALEISEMTLLTTSSVLKLIGGNMNTAAKVIEAIPYIEAGGAGFGGSPVAVAGIEGRQIAAPINATGEALQLAAEITGIAGQIVGTLANYERRAQDWQLQKSIAEHEINQINFQIEAARIQVDMATREIQIHEQTIAQHKEVGDFYQRKFTSKELYNWMSGRLSGLYFQSYKLAFDLAKAAERAYQFEFGTNDPFVGFNYWDSRRKGLLAGETLRVDLARLEKAALDQDSRYLEITKHISLLRHDPQAFLALKQRGSCQFTLDELLFDRDFPGHYFRIIKAITLSIPAVIGPYQTFKATLTQTGHKTLLAPEVDGVNYLLGEVDEMPGSIRVDWRANQQIAISTGVEDSGMFELNFNDGRYLPFEGTGAVSTWQLELPRSTNAIDFDTITDVIIHLRYMAKADYGTFKVDVQNLDVVKTYAGARLLSLAHEFSAQWHAFKNNANRNELELPLADATFPLNVQVDPQLHAVTSIMSVAGDGALTDVTNRFGVTWRQSAQGVTTLVLTARANFRKAESENLLATLSYEGVVKE